MNKQPEALTFPELLETVPNDAYLNIQHETEPEVRIIPVGRYCHNAAAELRRLHAQRDALLEVLKLARSIIGHPDDAHTQMIDAAIKAVEGEKT